MLLADGIACTVFERAPALGGVWAAGYSNFGVQVQRELYEFPDWPLPPDAPDFTPGATIQRYLEDYARHFEVWPRIRFATAVSRIDRPPGSDRWLVESHAGGARRQEAFDLVVVCVGLYSNRPHIPSFPGRERFNGEVIHISELASRAPLVGRRVAVVGYGKSATDAALESVAVAESTTLIFREPHWPVPSRLLGVLPFKWAMLNRLTSSLLPPYYRPSVVERVLHGAGKPLVWLWWRLVELLLIAQCGLGSRGGARPSLVPTTPVEIDAFSEAVMLPRPAFFARLRDGGIEPVQSGIAAYTPTGVALTNGTSRAVDVVVLATGWETDYGFLAPDIRALLGFMDDGLYLYRQMLHPDVPRLAFVGQASTIASILTYNLQARWLAELIRGSHRLPAIVDMHETIEQMKAWKRASMPFSRGRAARLLLHMLHYHDELLRDLGISPLRKRGVFAPFKEVFAPYEPSDYRDVVAGTLNGAAPATKPAPTPASLT